MVGRILAPFFLLLSSKAGAVGLNSQLDHTTLALGEPLTLTLTGNALEQIELAPLAADFQVQSRTLSRAGKEETLVLTLYPLRGGRLLLPVLHAGVARTRPARVRVTPGSADTPQVRFRVETEPTVPVQRQPTRLTLEACDDDSLDWRRPTLPLNAALYLRPLGEEQKEANRDGVRCSAHRWHWVVIPTQAGPMQLSLPMLEAQKFGRRLLFPAPVVAFSATPVPAWLPLNVAIGQPRLMVEKLPAIWPVERPLAWRFEVVGGYSEDGLKALLALQLQDQPGLNGYSPTVETLTDEDRNSPLARLRVTLYASARESGPLVMPSLSLPWYDPASGRLEGLTVRGGEVRIVNPALESLGRWLALVLAVGILAALSNWTTRRLAWRWRKRRGLAEVAASSDMQSLARAVRAFSLQAQPHPAATLGLWRERLRDEARCEGLDAMIDTLERARYGETHGERSEDFPWLQQHVLQVLRACHPGASRRVGAAVLPRHNAIPGSYWRQALSRVTRRL